MDFFGNAYNFISFIIAIIGIILAFYALKPKKKDRLALIHGNCIKLFHDLTRNFTSLKIKHNNSEIDANNELLYYSLYLQNVGRNDIHRDYIQENIILSFGEEIDIIDYKIISLPKEINPNIEKIADNKLSIDFDLLKQQEIIKIDFIFKIEKKDERDFSKSYLRIKPSARILNFNIEEKLFNRRSTYALVEELLINTFIFGLLFFLIYLGIGKNVFHSHYNKDLYTIEKKDSNSTNKTVFYAEVRFLNSDSVSMYNVINKKDSVLTLREFTQSYDLSNKKRKSYSQTLEFWLIFGSLFILIPLLIAYILFRRIKSNLSIRKRIRDIDLLAP